MEQQALEVLQARLERVERRLRMVAAGWVVSLAVVAVQQATSQPEVLRARRIQVVDTAGRTRIALGVRPGWVVVARSLQRRREAARVVSQVVV